MTATPSAAVLSASALHDLLLQQAQLYDRLAQLAQQQGPLVDAADPDPLLELLSQRQRIIAELSVLNARMAPTRRDRQALAQVLAGSFGSAIQALMDRIDASRDAVMKQDERDCGRIRQWQGAAMGEMGRVARASQAVSAYRPRGAVAGPSTLTDSRG